MKKRKLKPKKETIFIGIMNKPKTKKLVYLILANLKKNNQDKNNDFLA